MADLKIQGEVVVDASQAESALDRVGSKAESMAAGVGQSAGQAGKAVDGIGDKAETGAQKFTRAEARMRDAIRKSTLELQQFGKTASEKLEFKLADKGLDASKFQPYLAELRKVEAAHQAASGTLDGMGMSAKATAAALRGVPAQFTDIVTALQGGQRPLTVLMQQGGQLKDMFGGVGAAARALGGYVLGLVNPFTIAAAAVGAIALAYNQGSREQDAFVKSIVTTGNISGVTAGQLGQYARAISSVAGTQSKAAETLAAFVAEGVRGGAMLEKYAQTAIEWEKATGQSVAKTAEQFASLQKDPLSAVLKLNEGTNFLTESVYKQIKALDEQGRSADASKVAMDALNTAMESRSKTIEQNLGYIESAWRGITSAAKNAWDAMLNIGRSDSLETQIDNVRAKIAQAKGQDKNRPFSMPWDTSLADLEKQLSYLTEQERMLRRGAEAESERNKQLAARIEFDKSGEQYLSKRARMEREIAKATEDAAAAGVGQAELEQRIASIREKFAEKNTEGMKAQRAAAKLLAEDMAALAKMAGLSPDFYKEWDKLNDMFKRGKLDVDGLTQAQAKLLEKQPVIAAETKAQADAQKQVNASIDAYRSALQAVAKEEAARVDGIAKSNADLREQIATMGLTNQQIRARTIELNRNTIAEKQRQLAAMQGGYTNTREQAALEEEIRLLKERNELLGDQGAKEKFIEGQQEMADTWKSIDQTAHDVFVNIFEDGAGTFKRLGQTLKAALLDWLYQMTVRKWIINIGASFGGVGGLAGGAMAGQGGGGGGNAISSIWSLMNGSSITNMATGWISNLGANIGGEIGAKLAMNSEFLGSIVGGVGNAFAGYGISKALSGGYSAGGWVNTAAGVASAIPGIGPIAGVIGGLVNRAFGRKLTDWGIEGTFGGEAGFAGDAYQFHKGGWFRSDKTTREALDPKLVRTMGAAWKAIETQVTNFADVLGLQADRIDGFSTSFKFSTKDLDPKSSTYQQDITAKINEALTQGSNEMAERILGTWTTTTREVEETIKTGFWDDETFTTVKKTVEETTYAASEYAREGERAIDTLTRLATSLQATNAAFDMLGLSLYEASLAGGDMASKLIDQMGGMDAFGAQVGAYWQNYYTEAERHAYMTAKMTEALAAAGLEMPTTVAGFRALVDAQDLTTDAGRAAFAALMSVNAAFTEVYGNADAAAGSIAGLGAELAALEPIVFGAASDLASVIEQGLLGTLTGAQLGEQMADVVMQGMYSAIAGGFSQQITALMVEGVLNPMIAAAMTGASMSAAVSQAAIDRVIQQAQAAAAAINAVLSDPGFQAAIQQVQAAVGSISVGIQRPEPIYDSYAAQNARALAAQREAERLAQQAAQEAQRAADEEARRQQGIMNERLGLTKQLLQLEGNTVLLRQIELEALDPSNRALQQRIWAIEDETAAAEKYKSALKDAQDFLGGFTKNIEAFIFKVSHAQADAQQSYQMAAAKFTAQMTLARGGDRDAMNGITGYADTLIGSIRRESTTGAEANLRIARVLGQLASLPKQISAEQLIVDAIVNANTSLETVLSTNFASLDANVDGLLTAGELAASGLATNTQISALMARVDANGDGMISKQELANSRLQTLATEQCTTNTNLGNVTSAQNSTNSWLSQIQMADVGYSLSNVNAINSSTSATVAAINKTNAQIGTFNRNYDNPVTAQFSADSPLYSIFKGIDETNTWLYKLHGLSTASIQYWIALLDNEHRPVTVTSLNRIAANGSVFAEGGYTGPGAKWEPAGVVHKGEVVWSQDDVARWGGPGIVDALRQGAPGYADGGPVAVRVPQIYVPPVGRSNEETQALLREVLAELRAQRSDDRARHSSLAEPLQRMDRRGAKWDKDGLPAERTNEAIA